MKASMQALERYAESLHRLQVRMTYAKNVNRQRQVSRRNRRKSRLVLIVRSGEADLGRDLS